MIQVKWVAAILIVFLMGFVLSGTYDQVWVETPTGQQVQESEFNYVTSFSSASYTNNAVGTVTSVPTWTGNWFTAFWQCATFNPTFMQGTGYQMVRYFILLPFITIPGLLAIGYALYMALTSLIP
jgi:hypothetical protein